LDARTKGVASTTLEAAKKFLSDVTDFSPLRRLYPMKPPFNPVFTSLADDASQNSEGKL
jgi:hypothetical protein